jgi:ABC-type transport system involved in cytochrome c biogenesis permease component
MFSLLLAATVLTCSVACITSLTCVVLLALMLILLLFLPLQFTPLLAEAYNAIKAAGKNLEIVYVGG